MIKFHVDKMFKLPGACSLRAFCDVCINDAIVIKGVRLMEGQAGMFIGMPREQGKDNKWYDQVVCKDARTFDDLSNVVIQHYNMNGVQAAND